MHRILNALTNPVVVCRNDSITFPTAIKSGDYIEYQVGDSNAKLCDSQGNAKEFAAVRKGD